MPDLLYSVLNEDEEASPTESLYIEKTYGLKKLNGNY